MKFILPLTIILICVGAYFMYISPVVTEVKTLSVRNANYNEVLLNSKKLTEERDDILIDKNNIADADINKLNKIVPETFNSVLFANDINSIASRNGLVIKDFKIDPQRTEDREMMLNQTKSNPYKTIVVTFRLIGQYDKFVAFLKELEVNLRLVDIVKLTIRTLGGQRSTDNSLEYVIEMNTYSLR